MPAPAAGSHRGTDPQLHPLFSVLDRTDERLMSQDPEVRVWPTGFPVLDEILNGGLRAGSLCLIAGTQGLGKTTFTSQIARNVAYGGRPVLYFSYEHDPETQLEKLIALEIGDMVEWDGAKLQDVRRVFEAKDHTLGTLRERLAYLSGGVEALDRIHGYAHNLHLHRSTGNSTSMATIANAVAEVSLRTGEPPLVVIDYLQKVKVPGGMSMGEDERVTLVVEEMKDLAIDAQAPVISIVAGDKDGVGSGKRMRGTHMRGSTALVYEADVVLVLNAKEHIVARHHLVYDTGRMDRYKEWAILSVEKNRLGKDAIDLEFQKDFAHARYHIHGQPVAEQLVDERVFTE